MHVNVSYAVNLEKLPLEVKKLLVEARVALEGQLLDSFEKMEGDFDDENYFRILKTILEAREQLYNIDTRLHDCHGILSDYQKLLLEGEKTEESAQQLPLNFEGSDIVVDEQGNLNLETNEDEER